MYASAWPYHSQLKTSLKKTAIFGELIVHEKIEIPVADVHQVAYKSVYLMYPLNSDTARACNCMVNKVA